MSPNPTITPEENDRRFRECLQLIRNVTHDQLVAVMGEDFLERFRRASQPH
jgi:nicotinamide riboside kinase